MLEGLFHHLLILCVQFTCKGINSALGIGWIKRTIDTFKCQHTQRDRIGLSTYRTPKYALPRDWLIQEGAQQIFTKMSIGSLEIEQINR